MSNAEISILVDITHKSLATYLKKYQKEEGNLYPRLNNNFIRGM